MSIVISNSKNSTDTDTFTSLESTGSDSWIVATDANYDADQKPNATTNADYALSLPSPSLHVRNPFQGAHAAILRSLRAAGIMFLRYAIVDSSNTLRCKTVPLSHAISQLPHRNKGPSSLFCSASVLDNAISLPEIAIAGVPYYADKPVPSSNLTSKNVLVLQPDLSSLRILPYASKTAMVMCTAHDQHTQVLSPLCTRGLLERVLHLARDELGVEFCVGAELEFMLFRDDVPIDSSRYGNSRLLNSQEDFISSVYEQLEQQDIHVELIHSESAAGQLEMVLSYTNNVLQLADDVVMAQETIVECAKQHGMKALFLPKTSMEDAGNGLHLHFSFRDVTNGKIRNENAFSDSAQPTGISVKGQHFMEGILRRLPSLLSFSIPTTNSFRRMGPGCWTGFEAAWSMEDKEVPIRVSLDFVSRKVTNVEYKLSDATANIYLELAMILSAGMKGMKCEMPLRPIYDCSDDVSSDSSVAEPLPQTLQESLDLLKKDDFLLQVMGEELSTAYIAVRENEVEHTGSQTLEEEFAVALQSA